MLVKIYFSTFFLQKAEKKEEKAKKYLGQIKKKMIFELGTTCWSRVLFPEKSINYKTLLPNCIFLDLFVPFCKCKHVFTCGTQVL